MGAYPWKWFLFSFEGRITRFDFWVRFTIPVFAVGLFLEILLTFTSSDASKYPKILGAVFNLLVLWPSLAVSAKRLHDRNLTAFWLLPAYTAIICSVAAVYFERLDLMWSMYFVGALIMLWLIVEMGFCRGTDGDNRFGHDPLEYPSNAVA